MNRVIAVAAAAMMLASAANAVEVKSNGAYIGAALGASRVSDDGLDALKDIGYSVDEKGVGYQLWGGYKFFKWLAVEARYTDLGRASAQGFETDGVTTIFGEGTVDARALTANALFILPFGETGLDIYGQVGAGIAKYSREGRIIGMMGPEGFKNDDTDFVATVGGGVRWTPLPVVTFSLALDAYSTSNSNDGQSLDNLTLLPRFGLQANF